MMRLRGRLKRVHASVLQNQGAQNSLQLCGVSEGCAQVAAMHLLLWPPYLMRLLGGPLHSRRQSASAPTRLGSSVNEGVFRSQCTILS